MLQHRSQGILKCGPRYLATPTFPRWNPFLLLFANLPLQYTAQTLSRNHHRKSISEYRIPNFLMLNWSQVGYVNPPCTLELTTDLLLARIPTAWLFGSPGSCWNRIFSHRCSYKSQVYLSDWFRRYVLPLVPSVTLYSQMIRLVPVSQHYRSIKFSAVKCCLLSGWRWIYRKPLHKKIRSMASIPQGRGHSDPKNSKGGKGEHDLTNFGCHSFINL